MTRTGDSRKKHVWQDLLLFILLAAILSITTWIIHMFMDYPRVREFIPHEGLGNIAIHAAVFFLLFMACLAVYFVFRLRFRELRMMGEADRMFRSLFENSRDAVFIRSVDGVYVDVNRAMLELFRYDRDEMIGMNVDCIYANPADRLLLEERIGESGAIRDHEVTLVKKDGTAMTCLVNANAWRGASGKLLGYEGIIRDVTGQRTTENSLRESEERYRLIFSGSPLGIFHFNVDGTIVDCNEKFVEVIGSSRAALVGFNMLKSLRNEALREQVKTAIWQGKGFYEGDYRSVTADKTTPVRVFINRITTADGRFLGAVGIVEDLTESAVSQEARRKSEERFRAIFEGAAMGVILTSLNGAILEANASFAEMTGYRLDEIRGRALHEFTHPEDYDDEKAILEQLVTGSINRCQIVKRQVRSGGGLIWVRQSASLLHDREGKPEFIIGVIENITERRKAKEDLAREKERLAVTLTSIGDGVITTDVRGRVVMLNRVAENLTGWKSAEAADRPLSEVFSIINEDTREPRESPAETVIAGGSAMTLEGRTVLVSRDGTERVIADSGAPIRDSGGSITGVVIVFRDVTGERKIEEELRKAQKLESIGILAGGIAHDFNNILTSIMGSISLVKLKLGSDGEVRRVLEDAERASHQATELTRQLLTFSRGGAPVKKTVRIADLLEEVCGFSARGSSVKCEFDIAADLWPADVDTGQMSQVIQNILINAIQAMPEGGTVSVRAGNAMVSSEPRSLMSGPGSGTHLVPGNYVRIDIEDEGRGIPPEFMERIFDPYFTTKEKGMGLGLAIAYSIVRRHQGMIEARSRRGEGTTFSIYLPASPGRGPEDDRTVPEPRRGAGKILVMDDDENVLGVAEKMLRYLGYSIALSRNGYEAIDLYRKAMDEGSPYDAVIMDLTIPGSMGGRDCIEHLLKMDPGVKAVVSSGYSHDPVMADHARYGFRGIIAKPYSVEELSAVLAGLTVDSSGA